MRFGKICIQAALLYVSLLKIYEYTSIMQGEYKLQGRQLIPDDEEK